MKEKIRNLSGNNEKINELSVTSGFDSTESFIETLKQANPFLEEIRMDAKKAARENISQDSSSQLNILENRKENKDLYKLKDPFITPDGKIITIEEALKNKINKIFEIYHNSPKDNESFEKLINSLSKECYNNQYYQDVFDRCWSQDQIDEILDYFNKNKNVNISDPGFSMFTTSSKKEKGEFNTVSDYFAKALIKIIEKEDSVSENLQHEMSIWAQNIQMADSEIRLELLLSILNNPNKVNEYTKHEIIANMGFYGNTLIDQTMNLIKKKNKDINASLRAIEFLDFMKDMRYKAGFEYAGEYALEYLNKISEENDNFFVVAKLKQIGKIPLDDWNIDLKRSLVEAEWNNIIITLDIYEYYNPEELSDDEIEEIFDTYREVSSNYFEWQEKLNLKNRYNNDDLRFYYNINPISSKKQDSSYARLNKEYGAVFNIDGKIDVIFKFNQDIEKEIMRKNNKYGEIDCDDLEFFIDKFVDVMRSNDIEGLLNYYQIRSRLPDDVRNKIDFILQIPVPKELDKKFETMAQFESEIKPFQEEIIDNLSKDFNIKSSTLVKELEKLTKRKNDYFRDRYFGFSHDDTDLLEFFAPLIYRNPNNTTNPHFSLSYYLYLRKYLPEDLIRNFEDSFSINIPEKIQYFNTFDDYLAADIKLLFQPFINAGGDRRKMQKYLYEEILSLKRKIDSKKFIPSQLSISEILSQEGFQKENMSEEEYEKLILTYNTLIELPMRETIENKFQIHLEDFSIREQVQFVNFLSSKTVDEVEEVKEFLNKSSSKEAHKNRIKSFLSLELDPILGQEILNIGEKLPREQADQIFAKYAEIADMVYGLRDEIKNSLKNPKDINKIDFSKISSDLLKTGKKILENFADRIEGGDRNIENISQELEQFKKDVLLYKTTIKNSKDLKLEYLKGISFFSMDLEEIKEKSPEDLDQMRAIYLKNLKEAGKEERIGYLFDDLIKGDTKTRFFILKKDGKVVSFFRFTEKEEEGTVFAGGFNIDQSWSGGQIGLRIAKETLNKEAEERIIKAHCDPLSPISSHYLGEMGFVAKDFDSEKFLLHIERNDKKNINYESLAWSEDKVLEEFFKKDNDISDLEELEILGLDLSDRETIAKVLNNATKKLGYVVTKMIRKENKVYYVFEKENKIRIIKTEQKAA